MSSWHPPDLFPFGDHPIYIKCGAPDYILKFPYWRICIQYTCWSIFKKYQKLLKCALWLWSSSFPFHDGWFQKQVLVWNSYCYPAKKRVPISQSDAYLISNGIDARAWNLKSQLWKFVQVPEGQNYVFLLVIWARLWSKRSVVRIGWHRVRR